MIALFLGELSDRWRSFDHYESVSVLGPQGELRPWNLFVQQQLGLIELRPRAYSERERRGWGGHGWLIGSARLTPWGTAVAWALLGLLKKTLEEAEASESDRPAPDADERQIEFGDEAVALANEAPGRQADNSGAPELGEEVAGLEQPTDESEPEPEFGSLQPLFQPYFPEWQTVYARPSPEVHCGTHIFKVTLTGWRRGGGNVWRRLAVPPDTSLDGLAGAILRAFKFDDDHMYDFQYRDQRGKSRRYNHPYDDEGPFTPEILVAETDLAVRDAMRFTFDYGDNWEFEVRLERIDAGVSRLKEPEVIDSAGKAPEQYPQIEE
jgi:hypothetical protein